MPQSEHQVDESSTNDRETDSLSSGVGYLMTLTVAQRGVGFIRTALFCRLLHQEELGQWSLIFMFVMLASPLTLMGITGSFGRYVEHYLQRGLAKQFLRRTAFAVSLLTVAAMGLIHLNSDWVATALLGDSNQAFLLVPASITLVTNIAFNFFYETSIALRRVKVGSTMDLISSWTFAVLGIGFVWLTEFGAYGVVLSYAAGNLLGSLFSILALRTTWNQLPQSDEEFTHMGLWRKLAPFALGLWMVNLINNLFDMVDRYMIVHFSGFPASDARGLVGQYFSSMAVPLLMVGVSNSLCHMVMPYLSEDWEAGRKDAVNDRVNFSMKLIGSMLAIGSTLIVLAGPVLFNLIFDGKYDAGYQVLPFTIAFCYWNGFMGTVYNYMFCVERTRLMCISTLSGLIVNISLNALLLPRLGLAGAGLATASGCLLNVVISLFLARRFGFKMHPGVLWVLCFPFACGFGPVVAAIGLATLIWVANSTNWFLTKEERHDLDTILSGLREKVLPKRFSSKSAGVGS